MRLWEQGLCDLRLFTFLIRHIPEHSSIWKQQACPASLTFDQHLVAPGLNACFAVFYRAGWHGPVRQLWADSVCPPWHGSSKVQFVYGGAQRGISLARGFFTGEATWKPPPQIASAL